MPAQVEADAKLTSARRRRRAAAPAHRAPAGKAAICSRRRRSRAQGGEAAPTRPAPRSRWPPRASRPLRDRQVRPRQIRDRRARSTRLEALDRARPRHRRASRSRPRPPASIRCRRALCGIALAVAPNEACYVPLGHREASEGEAAGLFAPSQALRRTRFRSATRSTRSSRCSKTTSVLKIGHDMKYDWLVFAQRGIEIGALRRHHADVLRARRRQRRPRHGRARRALARPRDHPLRPRRPAQGKAQVTFDCVADRASAAEYAAEDADVTLRLWRR